MNPERISASRTRRGRGLAQAAIFLAAPCALAIVAFAGQPEGAPRAAPAQRAAEGVGAAALAAAENSRQQQDAPTTRVFTCTEGGCHAQTISSPFLHGPAAVSACDSCHVYEDAETHSFTIKAQGRQLCDFCHINRVGTEGPVVHEPVGEGECLTCHDPHGAQTRKLLVRPSLDALCADCHADTLKGDHVHEPAAKGECLSCHDPHTSEHPGLLIDERRTLCLSCHEDHRIGIETDRFVHNPVRFDCLECHTTHVSSTPGQLKAEPRELCASCHEPVLDMARNAQVAHSPVTEGRACLNCHTPHTSNTPSLQHADPIASCLSCHRAPESGVTHDDGEEQAPNPAAPVFYQQEQGEKNAEREERPAPPAPELHANFPFTHGPVGEGDCAACHGVHGAEHTRLLDRPYTQAFYQDYNTTSYSLCYSCHEERLVTEQPTTEATGFRDGDVNLHALHVNREQGRTCRACHNAHASPTPAQIRERAPFGQWEIPLNFTQTETGGSCAPGCHRAEAYDREPSAPDGE